MKKSPLIEGLEHSEDQNLSTLFSTIKEGEKVDREQLSEEILMAFQSVIKGKAKLPPAELALLRDAFQKIVPAAPKYEPRENAITPEEYIKEAMEKNEECYLKAREMAAEYALEVEEKNKTFYNFVAEKV
jgi:hypothetical protein